MRQPDECRAWLESYGELKLEAARMRSRHERLFAQATQVTTHLSDEPRGSGGDKEKLLAALADADGEAMRKGAEAERRMAEIEAFIDCLPNRMGRMVLRLRYVDLLSWRELRRELGRLNLNYEERQVYRFHGVGLREAREEWKRRKEKEHG
jgi:hypothetical protein